MGCLWDRWVKGSNLVAGYGIKRVFSLVSYVCGSEIVFAGCVVNICCNFVWICLCLCAHLSKRIPFWKGCMILLFLGVPVTDVNSLVWWVLGTLELLMPQGSYHCPVSVCKEVPLSSLNIFWLMECVGIFYMSTAFIFSL